MLWQEYISIAPERPPLSSYVDNTFRKANNILVHIIMLLFKSHPVYRQLKMLLKTYALINMVRHFPVLHFQVVHFLSSRASTFV